MSRKFDPVVGYTAENLPGYDLLTTDAAREVAKRTQFRHALEGQYVFVNGYDLARVEAAGLRDERIDTLLSEAGWFTVTHGLVWFRRDEAPGRYVSIVDALLETFARRGEETATTRNPSRSAVVAPPSSTSSARRARLTSP